MIRLNLLLADWGDEDHFESLLSQKNANWGREYLQNVKCAAVTMLSSTYVTELVLLFVVVAFEIRRPDDRSWLHTHIAASDWQQ